jgi:hypothetical protein
MQSSGFNPTPNPYGTYPGGGTAPYGGNPANSGFMPSGPSTGFGPLADLIVKMLLDGIGAKIPSFGRPQVSDFAHGQMSGREKWATNSMAAVYGSNPMNRNFGQLGDNAIFQQFVTDSMSGGSRGQQMQQVLGRFGHKFTETNVRFTEEGHQKAAERAAQFVRNVDSSFTNEDGTWDYEKTAGFNRGRFTEATGEFIRKFGGDQVIMDMSETDPLPEHEKRRRVADIAVINEDIEKARKKDKGGAGGAEVEELVKERDNLIKEVEGLARNKGGFNAKIGQASDRLKEMAETMREAGNFFGPGMPFSQLTEEMANLVKGDTVSAGEVKSMMQKLQATAAVVDMSNEAFANYIKVMDEINAVSGNKISSVDLATQSITIGKAIEESGKARAEKDGKMYTGPTKEEAGLEAARLITGRENSADMIGGRVLATELYNANPQSERARQAFELTEQGKGKEALALLNEMRESGEISQSEFAQISTRIRDVQQGIAIEDIDTYKEGASTIYEGTEEEQEEKRKLYAARAGEEGMEQTFAAIYEKTLTRNKDLVEAAGGLGVLKSAITEDNFLNSSAMASSIKEEAEKAGKDISIEDAKKLAAGFQAEGGTTENESAVRTFFKMNTPEAIKERERQAESEAEALKVISGVDKKMLTDAGIGETTMRIAAGTISDLQKSGKPLDIKNVTETIMNRTIAMGEGRDVTVDQLKMRSKLQAEQMLKGEEYKNLLEEGVDPLEAMDRAFGKGSASRALFEKEEEFREKKEKELTEKSGMTQEAAKDQAEIELQEYRKEISEQMFGKVEDGSSDPIVDVLKQILDLIKGAMNGGSKKGWFSGFFQNDSTMNVDGEVINS